MHLRTTLCGGASRFTRARTALAIAILVTSGAMLHARASSAMSAAAQRQSHIRFGHDGVAPRHAHRNAFRPHADPDDRYWSGVFGRPGLDRPVRALLNDNGTLYAGGDFLLTDSTNVAHVARWNGTNWESCASALSSGCGYDSVATVRALAMYDGELVAAGTFSAAGGVAVHNIARWNGTTWSPLGGGLTLSSTPSENCPMVRALAVYDGALIAAGLFDHAGDTPVPGLARWDGTTWTRLGTAGFSGVSSLTLYRGGLVAGCGQYNLGVERGNGLALWDGENWSSLGGGLDGHVDALLARTGELVAAGVFAHAGGVLAHNIAAWDGGQWHPLGSGIDNWGNYTRTGALVEFEGDVIVGGVIGTAGGVPVACIARWDGATWHALDAGVIQPLFDADVCAAVIHADQLVVGGDFARAGDAAAEHVARWDGHAWSGMGPAGLGMDGLVTEITPYQGQFVVCGRFNQAGDQTANGVARWTGDTWERMDAGLAADSAGVFALGLHENELYGTASPLQADSLSDHVVHWDGSQWHQVGAAFNGSLYTIASFKGDLYVAGHFTMAGQTPASNIARWNGNAWEALGQGLEDPQYYVYVNDILVYHDDLIAGGNFTFAGGAPAAGIARWDGSAWHALAEGVSAGEWHGEVNRLATDGELLYVGGTFWSAGTVPATSVAIWDGTTWKTFGAPIVYGDGWVPPAVYAMAVHGSDIYVAGIFDRAGSLAVNGLARWDGSEWRKLGSGVDGSQVDGIVVTLRYDQDALYLGGWFDEAGGKHSCHIARWADPQVPVEVADFEAGVVDGAVQLRWRLRAEAASSVTRVHVERAAASAGPYARCSTTPLVPAPDMEFADRAPETASQVWYRLVLECSDGTTIIAGPVAVQLDATHALHTALAQPYEPAGGGPVSMRYTLATAEPAVRLALYDARGRQLWASAPQAQSPGQYAHTWDRRDARGRRLPRGVYFLRLETRGTTPARKLLLVQP